MNFHYQPLTLWCKCVYHISQGKCGGEKWKVLKYHLIPWVVERVKSTQSNTSVSYSPWRATSKMGWVPETSSLILSFYQSLESWERTGLFHKLQRWVMENFFLPQVSHLPEWFWANVRVWFSYRINYQTGLLPFKLLAHGGIRNNRSGCSWWLVVPPPKKKLVYFKHYDLFPKIKERLPGGIFRF